MLRALLAVASLGAALAAAAGTCARAGPVADGYPVAARPAARSAAAPVSEPTQTVDFQTQVRPLLQSHCSPCHFEGGKMYAQLPFDQPATIHHLGERLFTRIKADDEQALLRAFLAQPQEGRTTPD